jgi:N-acetyl-alpha-D-muramate 1-phosphate uridylyltransferase
MKINTALILCAGFGKRLNPLTLEIPKPLLELNNITMLESCINIIIKLEIKKIYLNTFHLSKKINDFIKNKDFQIEIQIIEDGKKILNTGGGILNMINHSHDSEYLIFNPDTLWNDSYISEITEMQNLYFLNKLDNILMLANKELSFDKELKGDFDLKNNLLKKNDIQNFIYTGCQILNKKLFDNFKVENFSISKIWNELLKKEKLNGFESFNQFYHITNLETFKKLKDF